MAKKKLQSSTDYLAGLKEWSLPAKTPPKKTTPSIPSSNVTFDPSGFKSNLGRAARAASSPDPSPVALLRGRRGKNGKVDPHGLYASAEDALDAFNMSAGDAFAKNIGDVVESSAPAYVLGRYMIPSIPGIPSVGVNAPSSTKPMFSFKPSDQNLVGQAADVVRAVKPIVTERGPGTRTTEQSGGESLMGPLGLDPEKNKKNSLSNYISTSVSNTIGRMVLPGANPADAKTKQPWYLPVTVNDASASAKEIAVNPSLVVNTRTKGYAKDSPLMPAWANSVASESGKSGDFAAMGHAAVADPNNNPTTNPLQPSQILFLKDMAIRSGWDISSWDSLDPLEMIYRATTDHNALKTTLRSVARTIGEVGAAPSGVLALSVAGYDAASGDTKQLDTLVTAMLAPYKHYNDVAAKDGLAAGFREFFTNDPAAALIALNAAIKITGTTVGAAGRLGLLGGKFAKYSQTGSRVHAAGDVAEIPHIPARLPVIPNVNPIEAVIAREAIARDNAAKSGSIVTTPQAVDITIGATGRNVFSTIIMREIKVRIAEKRRLGLLYRKRLLKKKGYTAARHMGNVTQGITIQVAGEFQRAIGRHASPLEKLRASFDLTWPKETFGRKPVTPSLIADYFRQEVDSLTNDIKRGVEKASPENTNQIKLWNDQIIVYDAIDPVLIGGTIESHNLITSRLRDVAREYGEANTSIISDALGVGIRDAKRLDYIRLGVVDSKSLKTASIALQKSKNADIAGFVRSQGRVNDLATRVQQYVSETGYGSYNRPQSRLRFIALRDALSAELVRAEALAKKLNHPAEALVYRDARVRLDRTRNLNASSNQALKNLTDDVMGVKLSSESTAGLPVEAQALYAQAQAATPAVTAAERVVADARAAHEASLTAAGLKATERNVANTRVIALAEKRINDAEENLASANRIGLKDSIAKAEANLTAAEERLVRLRETTTTKATLVEATGAHQTVFKSRQATLREVKKIIETQAPVLDTNEVSAALNAAGNIAAIVVKTRNDYNYFTIDRARAETIDAFIARVEAVDAGAMLHLMQVPEFSTIGKITRIITNRPPDTSAKGGFVRKGRFEQSRGALFATGQENTAKMWENLLFDTAELIGAKQWSKKMDQLIEASSIRFTFADQAIRNANASVADSNQQIYGNLSLLSAEQTIAYNTAVGEALALTIREATFNINDFKVVNLKSPYAKSPSDRTSLGTSASLKEPVSVLLHRSLNERTVDPTAPGDYYLVPRALYDGIQKAIVQESFRVEPGTKMYNADTITRAWRQLTLNVFPKTAFNNFMGSTILAIQAGAGPRAFYFAYKALKGEESSLGRLPIPLELRQRYYEQLTNPIGRNVNMSTVSHLTEPTLFDASMAFGGWWMNSMRHFNGLSEDFGRLAVWYSQAYPAAMRSANGSRFFLSMRTLNDDAVKVLDAMAAGDPVWATRHAAWMQKSFDFLGDLHRGGSSAAALRIGIPFWQWYAHMIKLTMFTMPVKYPGRTLFLDQLSAIGSDYQKQHGVMVPWGQDHLALWTDTTPINGVPQNITHYTSNMNWYPQSTVGNFFDRNGNPQPAQIGGAIVPWIPNSLLGAMSIVSVLTGGSAYKMGFGGESGPITKAKDEAGNPISNASGLGQYLLHNLYTSFPLVPVVMGMTGKADHAIPFPGSMAEKPPKYGAIPKDKQTDIVTMIDSLKNPSDLLTMNGAAALLRYMGRFGFNITIKTEAGLGPAYTNRIQDTLKYSLDKKYAEDRNIAKLLHDIHTGNNGVIPTPNQIGPLDENPISPENNLPNLPNMGGA